MFSLHMGPPPFCRFDTWLDIDASWHEKLKMSAIETSQEMFLTVNGHTITTGRSYDALEALANAFVLLNQKDSSVAHSGFAGHIPLALERQGTILYISAKAFDGRKMQYNELFIREPVEFQEALDAVKRTVDLYKGQCQKDLASAIGQKKAEEVIHFLFTGWKSLET